ncbi:hypothetical protein D9757_000422 [Collybiopsis confluens]|uniref:JmjC domain-containing protein n=1 Tax=Collybiopsis confluens TaxID=2823264 RepID=A0A8H5I256_9AGAR|nr:hypothetical protein D9757_000422 [Collybiopsis confluens]
MSVGQRGHILPAMPIIHKKTNLSQILNPTGTQSLNPTGAFTDYQQQRHQQYRNFEYAHPGQLRWDPRPNNEESASTPYPASASRYATNEQWETGRAEISGQSPDHPTHDHSPHVPSDALLNQDHHQLSMLLSSDVSRSHLQYSERASTRIQARATIEPPSNYTGSYSEINEDYEQPQGESSRKRSAPVEPVGPPKRAKKLSPTPASTGSKRGFTKKKRNEAEALRAQNAVLVPGVRYANETATESSDNRMRMLQPEESVGFGAGKLTPDLQTARCMSAKYKTEGFPKCVSCIRRWAGDTCRFQGIRIFLKDARKNLVGMSFVNNQKEEKPTMDFPKEWNTRLEDKDLLRTMRITARQLLPTLHAERRHVNTQEIIYRPREYTCMTSLFCCSWMCRLCGRETCPECYEELVAITGDPNADLRNSQSRNSAEVQAQMASRIAAQKARKERQSHSNPSFLTCTKRQEHRASEFTPVSRFCLRELNEAIRDMEAVLEDDGTEGLDGEVSRPSSSTSNSTSVRTPADLSSSNTLNGRDKDLRFSDDLSQSHHTSTFYQQLQPHMAQPHAAHSEYPPRMSSGQQQAEIQCSQEDQSAPVPLLWDTTSYDSYSNLVSNASTQLRFTSHHVSPSNQAINTSTSQTPLYLPPSHRSDIPSHEIPRYAFDDLKPSTFPSIWKSGTPILVSDVARRFRIQWTPEYFIKTYGDQSCLIVECQTDNNKRVTVGEFFSEFGKYADRTASETASSAQATIDNNDSTDSRRIFNGPGEIWKLKDWPPSADFKTTFPELYEDFSNAVPIPNYVRRDGTLNIASHFPLNALAPDLGPKMYNAMASNQAPGSKGSTRLHMDMADALNVMTYAADCPDGSPGCAVWDLFRAEDSVKLRAYLKEKFPNTLPTDPIHGQQVYLDEDMRMELAEKWGVYSFRVYQRPGEAVFIPAGCAHQVCNLADCIKVAVDFVSPENVTRCEQLTREFREQNQSKVWKEDILQLRSMMWFAWLSSSQQWDRRKRHSSMQV